MHARVTRISGSPANVDAAIQNFRTNVLPFARGKGGKGALLLIARESGDAIAITLWEDEQALRASEERANALRADAADQLGAAETPAVARYEVAVFDH